MKRLGDNFARRATDDSELMEILAYYVARKLDDLKEAAQMIDKEYESDASGNGV